MQYVYPAVFIPEETESGIVYNVGYPDIPGCLTFGESISNAIEMAREALAGCLTVMQQQNDPIPVPSPVASIHCTEGFVSLIDLDMEEYRKRTEKRAVKRTVSLPQWLDSMAQEAGINFSQTIQEAIKERLGV